MIDQPSLFDRDHPAPHSPYRAETSIVSAYLAAPKHGSECAAILDYMRRRHPRPLTAAEIAEQFGMVRNQCAARLWDLRRSGWVEWAVDDAGEYLTAPTGGKHRGRLNRLTVRALERAGR